jgi:hypothetical protein
MRWNSLASPPQSPMGSLTRFGGGWASLGSTMFRRLQKSFVGPMHNKPCPRLFRWRSMAFRRSMRGSRSSHPQKATQELDGQEFHAPCDARPLTIVNTDDRPIGNATRLRIEPLVALGISAEQRGFLPGRSLLSNVLDVDMDMRLASAGVESLGAVFFDLAAAFPSIANEFMAAVLERVGIPQEVRKGALYLGHGCKLAAAGELLESFAIQKGIRQGCPLSPLLFAICGDLVLREVVAAFSADTLRA